MSEQEQNDAMLQDQGVLPEVEEEAQASADTEDAEDHLTEEQPEADDSKE